LPDSALILSPSIEILLVESFLDQVASVRRADVEESVPHAPRQL